MIESATLVQVKSTVADGAEFTAMELNAIFSAASALSACSLAVETTQTVVIDRSFAGISNSSWAYRPSEFDAWGTHL